ncbi:MULTISPECIES: GNAT family N-acetyltransferase [unclassified Streptomyces]|uniref:GNAT family N-acetyltransferase n=1 Tax=Streptomyces TaxID=1883 RepID=UPI00136C9922|nr:GNAT family N-acetyltransferase [Streptomyces sp. SID335]MYZ12006.1 GNAT family N-acetyltransferase [Streptomyces sp. SID337]NDZ88018.1 GNAT family N-acetyltransferase [Streptomyces sp. SID10115]NEA03721.1 GNAT family N-acetyltransferase [Streptomyces sp. SID10116]NEB49714.1 GNAT family N-acetyltransferase [Streptomyces sp. SID339]
MERTTTYLEMTDPDDLRPAPAVPGLDLLRLDRGSPLVRGLQARVGAAHGWRAATCTEQEWNKRLAMRPSRQYWALTLDEEPIGVSYLEPQTDGDVEITAFGLLPHCLGKGLGAYALTVALRLAWATEPLDAATARRVWLHTCNADHPHALGNYRGRGMRVYREERHG